MKGRTVRGFQLALVCTALGGACASEEGNDFNRPVPGNSGGGGKGGSGGKGGGGGTAGTSTGGKGGTSGGTAGKGGTAGSGGNSSGGMGGTGGIGGTGGSGGNGVAGDCSALNAEGGATSEIADSLHVEVQMDGSIGSDPHDQNQPRVIFNVVNGTDDAVSLPDLKVRYFFVSEFDCGDTVAYNPIIDDFRLQNPHVEAQKSDVGVDVVAVAENGAGCDAYIEFTFSGPESLAAGQYAAFKIHSAPPNDDYQTETDQTNDASYGACSTHVVPWEAVPLYQDDLLIWGDEPYTGGEGGEGGGGGVGGEPGTGGAPVGGQPG